MVGSYSENVRGLDEIERAWVLVQAPNSSDEDLVGLSLAILEQYNVPEDFDPESEEIPSMAIRADITAGQVRMVVPIFAADMGALEAMFAGISEMVAELSGASADMARVLLYSPFPSTWAAAYVTESEAYNPDKGLSEQGTGINSWG